MEFTPPNSPWSPDHRLYLRDKAIRDRGEDTPDLRPDHPLHPDFEWLDHETDDRR